MSVNRRDFLKLAGLGGVVFASTLARGADGYASAQDEFFFVQLSDTHWGFQGPAVNPDAPATPRHQLPREIPVRRPHPHEPRAPRAVPSPTKGVQLQLVHRESVR